MAIRDYNLPWIATATRLMGTTEVSGNKSNPAILSWAKGIGGWIASFYKDDDIPWCGLFVAHCMRDNGIEVAIKNPLSALEWNKFGIKTAPCFGCIMVFSRKGGGHVGFYVSEDDTTYHILGGNQSNTVNVIKVAKDRFVGARWPKDFAHLKVAGKIKKQFDGQISTNEK